MGDVYSGEFQNEQDGGVVRIYAEEQVVGIYHKYHSYSFNFHSI